MAEKNENTTTETAPVKDAHPHSNPFENSRPVADEINEAQEELENEQVFKEAQTERD